MTESGISSAPAKFTHSALLYREPGQYVSAVSDFVRAAIKGNAPVFVAVPGARLDALRQSLGRDLPPDSCADMGELGRNPGRILSALLSFAERHRGRSVHVVQELLWPGRSEAETLEAVRHEALTNTAFAGTPAGFLCPYDLGALSPAVVDRVRRTHPSLVMDGVVRPSDTYTDPLTVSAECDRPLPEPSVVVPALVFGAGQTARAREYTESWARGTALSAVRRGDLVLAVGEAIANSVAYGGGRGTLRIWTADGGTVVAEIKDGGRLLDPLAGRRRPHPASAEGGRGLWMMHQLCDLVEIRSAETGLTLRLHVALDTPAGSGPQWPGPGGPVPVDFRI
ncbi:anti-sigma regulatory factor [Streptomyces camponoticapitis]|uniref:Anti-sigma regulatory factor n=1 Tax=Streptomyces camponoticapitis TaxID=1616125 RepID=A0ABQ2EUA4_9ACTN|nr:sensor histidine kinase [Streptomyces camponoticapitis]GGK20983.1 anti-sigma regulatory factor [Streptomyces camponoticapitis]